MIREFQDLSLNSFMMDWVTYISYPPHKENVKVKWWDPQIEGRVKLNFDGSSIGDSGPAGFGCVVRDFHAKMLFSMCGLLGICGSTQEKLVNLLKGFRMLKQRGLLNCMIEGDSITVIS